MNRADCRTVDISSVVVGDRQTLRLRDDWSFAKDWSTAISSRPHLRSERLSHHACASIIHCMAAGRAMDFTADITSENQNIFERGPRQLSFQVQEVDAVVFKTCAIKKPFHSRSAPQPQYWSRASMRSIAVRREQSRGRPSH